MGQFLTRDRVLIGVVCVLVLILLIPAKKKKNAVEDDGALANAERALENAEPAQTAAKEVQSPPSMGTILTSGPIQKAKAAAEAIERRYDRMEKIADDPEKMLSGRPESLAASASGARSSLKLVGKEHPLMPLIPGSTWEYAVSGDKSIIPHGTWTMRVKKAPSGDEPGVLEVGFGDAVSSVHIFREGDTFLIDWLPFVEPLEYLNNRPAEVSGVFLGAPPQMIENSVWIQQYRRNILYQYQGEGQESYRRVAQAKQQDRAEVKGVQKVIALTSAHDAYVIEWSSLFEILVDERVVLNKLTTDRYRSEKMWMVPNIGIVRREIHYGLGDETQVVFDLVNYSKPAHSPL